MEQPRKGRTEAIALAFARHEKRTTTPTHRGYAPIVGVVQWAEESSWGVDVTGTHNYGGIKAKKDQARAFCWTKEWLTDLQYAALAPDVKATAKAISRKNAKGQIQYSLQDWFACFASVEAYVEAYCQFFLDNPRYHGALAAYQQHGDPERLLIGICDAGYATEPRYQQQLLVILRQSNVQEIVAAARKMAAAE